MKPIAIAALLVGLGLTPAWALNSGAASPGLSAARAGKASV